MDVESYQLDTAEQLWEELHDIVSGDYHSVSTREKALCAYMRLASTYMDQFLTSDEDLTRCSYDLINSTIFSTNRAYSRRVLIARLVNGDSDVNTRILIGAVLLCDGREHETTFEMMQEESATGTVISILVEEKQTSTRMHRIYLGIIYQMCRVQKLDRVDLERINRDFIELMFDIVESNVHADNDPYNYAVMKVLLALNEQFMIDATRGDAIENLVFEVLKLRGDTHRTFGENIVFLFNRGIDDTLQLMMMKLLYLIFTTSETFEYIYYNDIKVLTEVIMRQLTDINDDEEKLRHTYLRVLHPMLQNTQLRRDGFKKEELVAMLEQELNDAVYDETTVRLALRVLSVDWLEYKLPDSALSSNASSVTSSISNTPVLTPVSSIIEEHPGSGKFLTIPPPPPPRRRKPVNRENGSINGHHVHSPHSSHSPHHHPHKKPPRPPSRKLMSIRNTSAMDVASYRS